MVVRFLLRALLLIFALLPVARGAGTVLLVADDNSAHAEFAASLSEHLRAASWTVERTPGNSRIDLVVSAGNEAFRKALAGNLPVFAALIQRSAYERILAEAGRNRPRSSAVFLEQPPARQAAFIRLLLPGFNRVGLLGRSETRATINTYQQALNQAGLIADSETCERDSELLPALNALLPRTSLLLATADTEIYRRENIKTILITSYRYHKPVIAFSPTFVQAGALAAVYTSPAQFGQQLAELIASNGTNLPPPRDPQAFSLAINRNVAQALNLVLPDEAVLRRTMNEREGR